MDAGTFSPNVDFPLGVASYAMATGDLDEDGKIFVCRSPCIISRQALEEFPFCASPGQDLLRFSNPIPVSGLSGNGEPVGFAVLSWNNDYLQADLTIVYSCEERLLLQGDTNVWARPSITFEPQDSGDSFVIDSLILSMHDSRGPDVRLPIKAI